MATTSLALAGLAYADDVEMVQGTSNSMSVPEGGTGTFTVQLVADNAGAGGDPVEGCNATVAHPVTITLAADDTWAAVDKPSVKVTDCTTQHTITVSVDGSPAASAAGARTKITGTATPGPTVVLVTGKNRTETVVGENNADFINVQVSKLASAPAPAPDADGDGIPDVDDTNSYAPAVGLQAGDANGNEGTPGNPVTSGSFTDQDGNGSLAISMDTGGAGTLVDNGNGTFSWSHTTTDDASGSVTVRASDGEHADATQTFSWTAANVAPVIGAVTVTPTGPCSVSVSAAFADQGSADTHSSAISWGDLSPDSTVPLGSEVTPVTGSHTYSAAGTYTIGVTVTDDDDDFDSKDAPSDFITTNTPSAIMQPINSTGTRSGFKRSVAVSRSRSPSPTATGRL